MLNGSPMIIIHPVFDLAMLTGCPHSSKAVNMNTYANPRVGDSVIAYGEAAAIAPFYQGYLSGISTNDCGPSSSPPAKWSGSASICAGEFYIQSNQHDRGSGALVVNSCGLVGMAHAVETKMGASFAGVIPAAIFADFFDSNIERLSECTKTGIEDLPVYPYIDCDVNKPPYNRDCHTSGGNCTAYF